MTALQTPGAYTAGYATARGVDAALADAYIRHTRIGDPDLDPVIEDVADLTGDQLQRGIRAGIERDDEALRQAPRSLRHFFEDKVEPPAWLDFEAHAPAVRAFNVNAANVLVAFVCGVLIEGFSTLISKSFATTGRVLNPESARRRLMQNNRHLMEVFFPGGMERDGDGWKLSTRLRFVHARVRHLLANSGAWDVEHYGTPVSAAHLGLATTVFSMRLLEHAALVGAVFNEDEQASVMQVWRYTGVVMGVPEGILFVDRDHARRIFEIAHLCEPEPDSDAASMANALIGAIPLTAGIEGERKQRKVMKLAYRLSRSLIGNQLADQLAFPKMNTMGSLAAFRARQRLQRFVQGRQKVRLNNFSQLLDISVYDRPDDRYRMPDHYLSARSNPW
ncbi:MAG: oxygenase MpaB family protein [Gammaproteobacteria bacterium]|nr:oxygenase MpaB family protein [Gammaproteobacteria bacterium]